VSAELAKRARTASRDKARSMVGADPSTPKDASGYRPPDPLNANIQTGLRPIITRRKRRSGGKVAGSPAALRADRKPRAAGGMTASEFINRDVRAANEDREGIKHDGGFARGGVATDGRARARKFMGGPMQGAASPYMTPQGAGAQQGASPVAIRPGMSPMMRKKGGKVHADAAQDRELVHKMGCKCGKCSGGRIGRASGGKNWIAGAVKRPGALHKELGVAPDKKIPAKKLNMAAKKGGKEGERARLAKTLKGLPHKSTGGEAGANRAHSADGIIRPTRAKGGRASGKTNINIIVAPAKPAMAPPMGAPMPPGGPMGLRQAPPPPPAMPPQGIAPGPPAGMPPGAMMGRKSGGRAYPIKDGAGGGKGRLEKIRAYG
jgi:hypothetical protein